jgi:hypothetical protein
MKLSTFNAHREGIAQTMRENLTFSKHVGYPIKDYCGKEQIVTISFDKDIEPNELREKLEKALHHLNDKAYVGGTTFSSGRYDYFKAMQVIIPSIVIRDKIENEQIENAMRQLVKKELRLKEWENLECKVMALYKQSLIEWEDVVLAHKIECK